MCGCWGGGGITYLTHAVTPDKVLCRVYGHFSVNRTIYSYRIPFDRQLNKTMSIDLILLNNKTPHKVHKLRSFLLRIQFILGIQNGRPKLSNSLIDPTNQPYQFWCMVSGQVLVCLIQLHSSGRTCTFMAQRKIQSEMASGRCETLLYLRWDFPVSYEPLAGDLNIQSRTVLLLS